VAESVVGAGQGRRVVLPASGGVVLRGDGLVEEERARAARVSFWFDRMVAARAAYEADESPYPVDSRDYWRDMSEQWVLAAGVGLAHWSRDDCHPDFREDRWSR
jgi:hypothetical protein